MNEVKKIGIMGGTFDPIHYGHLVLAEQVRSNLALDSVYFVPSGQPPHKSNLLISDKNSRLKMVEIAINDNKEFNIFDYELNQTGYTYTIDTIKAFRRLVEPNAKIYFITGADQLMLLESWKDYEQLLKEVIFVAASRPGHDEKQVVEKVEYFKKKYHAQMLHVEIPALSISSTNIRNRVREGNSIKYLLPDRVEEYIINNRLYL